MGIHIKKNKKLESINTEPLDPPDTLVPRAQVIQDVSLKMHDPQTSLDKCLSWLLKHIATLLSILSLAVAQWIVTSFQQPLGNLLQKSLSPKQLLYGIAIMLCVLVYTSISLFLSSRKLRTFHHRCHPSHENKGFLLDPLHKGELACPKCFSDGNQAYVAATHGGHYYCRACKTDQKGDLMKPN